MKDDVIFSLQVFIHIESMSDDKMMCHYIHTLIEILGFAIIFCN